MSRLDFDGVLILGAGLAGLSAALAAAPRRALVITPEALGAGCSSAWAQGGVAVALAEDDTPALHAADTVAAGAGLVEAERAQLLTEEGPAAVMRLLESGRLSLDGLITHRRDAVAAEQAYRQAFTDSGCLKMLLDWRQAA